MKFAVENFKIFKERTEFDIRPLTILVGPNGCGKSSVVNALGALSEISFQTASPFLEHSYYDLSAVLFDAKSAKVYGVQNKNLKNENTVLEIFPQEEPSFAKLLITVNSVGEIELLELYSVDDNTFLCSQSKTEDYWKIDLKNFADTFIRNNTQNLENPVFQFPERGADIFRVEKCSLQPRSYPYTPENRDIPDEIIDEAVVEFPDLIVAEDTHFDFTKIELNDPELKRLIGKSYDDVCDYALRKLVNIREHTLSNIRIHPDEFMGYFPHKFSSVAELNISLSMDEEVKEEYENFAQFILNKIPRLVCDLINQLYNVNVVSTNRNAKKTINYENPTNEIEKTVFSYFNLSDPEHRREKMYSPENEKSIFQEKIKKYLGSDFLNIADDIIIDVYEEIGIASIKLIKGGVEYNISELGYGVSNLVSVVMNLVLADARILNGLNKFSKQTFNPKVDFHSGMCFESILIIEEPEMNLHPNLQSKLADVFVDCMQSHDVNGMLTYEGKQPFNTLVLETHSEYLIRRLQYLVAKGALSKDMVQIYYFNDPDKLQEGDERVYPININTDGSLTDDFGEGFFDETARNVMDLFLMREQNKN